VIAHRGLALDADENTLAAFEAALAAGADILETDVHASADGDAVICHDDDLSRIAGVRQRVGTLTVPELSSLRLARGGRLATLRDALEAFPSTRFNIDVKDDAAVVPTVRAIRDADAAERVLVTSFAQRRRRRALRSLRRAATSASTCGSAFAVLGAVLRIDVLVRSALWDVDAVQVPVRHLGLTVVSPALVRAVHRAGREVHVWTVNDPGEMARLLRLGVDGIITDRCDLLGEVLGRR
jgi:glycerophosphoryl diester phosphodiesterase